MSFLGTMEVLVTLAKFTCGQCGGTYAISEKYRKEKWEKNGNWNCPYCQCNWGYFGKTQLEKANERTERAEREANTQRALKHDALNSVRSHKAAKTRLKNRIKNGVCPCCKRTFTNVSRHMKCKHPDYSKGGK